MASQLGSKLKNAFVPSRTPSTLSWLTGARIFGWLQPGLGLGHQDMLAPVVGGVREQIGTVGIAVHEDIATDQVLITAAHEYRNDKEKVRR